MRVTKRRAVVITATAVSIGAGAMVLLGAARRDADTPITGPARAQAVAAALAHTGGGRVTGTEVGDEDSMYEVEVTLADGRQVDVQLDDQFRVVSTKTDAGG